MIVILGGEKSLLPGIKIAERFADYGIIGLAVSLFGDDGLPDSPDAVPLEMFIPAVNYLRETRGIAHISVYGQSMGSIFAVLVAQYIGGMENLIMVAPTHVPFEGTLSDKKTLTGRSVATWKGQDIPFVRADFSKVKAMKYQTHPAAADRVTGMWVAYYQAYQKEEQVTKAKLAIEQTKARILLIAGEMDEMWPASDSVRAIERDLKEKNYDREVQVIHFPYGGHLIGMMPNRRRERLLYFMTPVIGYFYKTFGKYRKENMEYFAQSEKIIVDWIKA